MKSKAVAVILLFVAFTCNIQALEAAEVAETKCTFGENLKEALYKAIDFINAAVAAAANFVNNVMKAASALLKAFVGPILDALSSLIGGIATQLKATIYSILNGVVDFTESVMMEIKTLVNELATALKPVVAKIVQTAGSAIKGIIQLGSDFMAAILGSANGISEALDSFAECFTVKVRHQIAHKKFAAIESYKKNLID